MIRYLMVNQKLKKQDSFVYQGISAIILLVKSFCSLLNKIIFVPNSRGGLSSTRLLDIVGNTI